MQDTPSHMLKKPLSTRNLHQAKPTDARSALVPVQESEGSPFSERTLREGLPAWLISFVTHLLILICLVLVPLHVEGKNLIKLAFGTGEDFSDDSFEVSSNAIDMTESNDIAAIDTALIETTVGTEEFELPSSTFSEKPKSAIQLTLAGRTGSMKSTLLAAYGGTKETEDAVELGLKWLARTQRSDGSWSLRGSYSNGGTEESKTAATAMAVLAFLGAGHTPTRGEYTKIVERGVDFLIKSQKPDGFMAEGAPGHHQMYAQAQATMVLCELYALEKNPRLREKAELAVRFAEEAQSRQGGWRYQPRVDSDLSVTGWFVIALMSARMGGLATDSEKLGNVSAFLDTVQSERGSLYAYKETDVDSPRPSMTAEGLLCRVFLGWPRYDERLRLGVEALLQHPIASDAKQRNYYYWYYATQTMHHYGGKPWTDWNRVMRRELPAMQIKDGPEIGSWPPEGDPYGVSGGRLYATCLAIYCLEIYYRHLPIYDIKMLTGAEDYIGIGK